MCLLTFGKGLALSGNDCYITESLKFFKRPDWNPENGSGAHVCWLIRSRALKIS